MDWKQVVANNAKKVCNKNKNTSYPRYSNSAQQCGGAKKSKTSAKKLLFFTSCKKIIGISN